MSYSTGRYFISSMCIIFNETQEQEVKCLIIDPIGKEFATVITAMQGQAQLIVDALNSQFFKE